LESRKIPDESLCYFYYTEDFSELARHFDSEHNLKPEPRLVIPFYNESKELIGVQGRSLEANSKVRYITLKKDSVEKLWYGLWRVNPQETIYITEGPIDSIFLPNAVAMVGAAGDMKLPEKIANSEVVYVFDNEKRNKQICNFMETVMEKGHKILIWPDVKVKDINDYVLAVGDPMDMISKNTYSGLEAKLRYMQWKK
jgi:DNA primase